MSADADGSAEQAATRKPYDPEEYRRELRHKSLIDDLHKEFGLCFTHDADMESGYALALKDDGGDDQWAIDEFLQVLSKRMQPAIAEYIRKQDERKRIEGLSVLVGGPFDGEKIDPHKNGGTEARMIRKRWWAVYKRKPGEYPAKFVGYAKSKANALSYTLAQATPAAEFPSQPDAE